MQEQRNKPPITRKVQRTMALSLNNLKEEATEYLKQAKKLGEAKGGEKDKTIFISDLKEAVEGVLASLSLSDNLQ